MNSRALILFLSVGTNIALGAWWMQSRVPHSEYVATTPTSATTAVIPATSSPLNAPLTVDTWRTLQADTDHGYAERLRVEGFPPDIIRVLVTDRIRARFRAKLDQLKPKEPFQFWRNAPNDGPDALLSPAARSARRAIEREISEGVRAAMGSDFDALDPYERAFRERLYGNLPREKAQQLESLNSDYRELAQQIRDRTAGILMQEDRDQLRLLEQEKRRDLAAVLTPDELFEYDLRASPSAETVRQRLTYFKPTEAEFRTLAQLQLEFDERYGNQNLSPAERTTRREAEKALEAAMLAALSPERATEFQFVTDRAFAANARFANSYNLDPTVARDLSTLQRSINDRADSIRKNPIYTAQVRAAELDGLYREASAKLTSTLGPKSFETYQNRGPSDWLKRLRSASATSTPRHP